MRAVYTSDGKCLACELQRRDVDPAKIFDGYEHVCLDLRIRDRVYTPDAIMGSYEKHNIFSFDRNVRYRPIGGPEPEYYILFDPYPRQTGLETMVPDGFIAKSDKLKKTLLKKLKMDIENAAAEEKERLRSIRIELAINHIANGRIK